MSENKLKKAREKLLMSRSELARKAGLSPVAVLNAENGKNCRIETKRKIILALGYTIDEFNELF